MPTTSELEEFDRMFGTSSTPAMADVQSQTSLPLIQRSKSGSAGELAKFDAAFSSPQRNVVDLPSIQGGQSPFINRRELDRIDYSRRNEQPGIPLNSETGASAGQRFRLGLHRDKRTQLDVLRKNYGPENVRLDTEGNFVVKSTDPKTGAASSLEKTGLRQGVSNLFSLLL